MRGDSQDRNTKFKDSALNIFFNQLTYILSVKGRGLTGRALIINGGGTC